MTSNPEVPPFTGYVLTTLNALHLIHAARQGVIPRITRRLNDSERRTMIKSGAVFIFSVEESGIKRWTDGLLWSPSRIVGNFLVYREINERANSRGNQRKPSYHVDALSRELSPRRNSPDQSSSAFKSPGHILHTHGQGDQGTFKADGLIKKTITVNIDGSDLHLISYYTSEDLRSGKLKRPSHRADIMSLYMPPHIFNLSNLRIQPKVEIGPDGQARFVCEPDDIEPAEECKTEEGTYHVAESPQWAPDSSIDSGFTETNLYHEPQTRVIASPSVYTRESASDRWPVQLDNLRMSPLDRQSDQWSPSPSPTQARGASSRRKDGNISSQAGSWSTLHSQSTRWRTESYDSVQGSGAHVERSRVRSNTLYENPGFGAHRRSTVDVPGYHHRLSSDLGGGREVGSQRLPWLPREPQFGEKGIRGSRPGASFSSPTLPFSQQQTYHRVGHPYNTTWGAHEHDSTLTGAPLHQIPSQSLHSYDTYTSASPEEFSKVDEFGDV